MLETGTSTAFATVFAERHEGESTTLPPLPTFGVPKNELAKSKMGQKLSQWVDGGPRNNVVSSARAETHRDQGATIAIRCREESSHQLRDCFIDDPPVPVYCRSEMLAQRKAFMSQQASRFKDNVRTSLPQGRTLAAPGRNPDVLRFSHLETHVGSRFFWGPHPHTREWDATRTARAALALPLPVALELTSDRAVP